MQHAVQLQALSTRRFVAAEAHTAQQPQATLSPPVSDSDKRRQPQRSAAQGKRSKNVSTPLCCVCDCACVRRIRLMQQVEDCPHQLQESLQRWCLNVATNGRKRHGVRDLCLSLMCQRNSQPCCRPDVATKACIAGMALPYNDCSTCSTVE